MKKKLFIISAVLVSILVIGLIALAFQSEDTTDRRDKIKERVGDLKMELLISRLEFDEATAEKIIEINEKYFDLMMEKVTERKEVMKSLETLYMEEEVNEKEIKSLIGDLFDLDEDIMTIKDKEMKEVSSLLTTEEFGRYLIFEELFYREMRKVIMEKAHDMPEGEFGPPEGGPDDGFGPPGSPPECGPDGGFGPPEGPPPNGGPGGDDDAFLIQPFADIPM
jgi:hypothetical protein